MTGANPNRRRRANGEESCQKILDAAAEVAGERGYEGTSIALVSERSGLPASSIYWHFRDKDALLAAVIERSFGRWLAGASGWVPTSPDAARPEVMAARMQQVAKALMEAPEFLRLGLMLVLERRPDEPTARTMFLQVREETVRRTVDNYRTMFPDLDDRGLRDLATFTMAMADGLFIAKEVDGDAVDLLHQFETLTVAVLAVADSLASRNNRSTNR